MIDMVGFDNGYFKVISFLEKRRDRFNKVRRFWNCLCICGNLKILHTYQITSKKPRSCGCYVQARCGNTSNHRYFIKHGLANKHPLYRTWKNMKLRCYNKNNKDFRIYGGKGIVLCNDWRDDFKSFYDWSLNNGWRKGLCIDRIDPSKDYMPSNCQFITASENSKKVHKDNPKLNCGENHNSATITEDIVREIRKLYVAKVSQSTIMSMFNISRNIAYQIKYNKTWKHVK